MLVMGAETELSFMTANFNQNNLFKEKAMNTNDETRPPRPPFTTETAIEKVRLAEDGWNSRDPQKVSLALGPTPGRSSRTQ